MLKRVLIGIGVVGVAVITWLFFRTPATQKTAAPQQSNSVLKNVLQSVGIISEGRSNGQTSTEPFDNSAAGSPTAQNSGADSNQPVFFPKSANKPVVPTQSITITPQQAQSVLPLPTEANVDPALFNTTSINTNAAIKSYAQSAASAVSDFDLIDDAQAISEKFQTMDPQTIKQMATQAQAKADAIKNIPVPSAVLGMSERYYQTYGNYAKMCNLILGVMDPKLSQADRQQKFDQVQNISDDLSRLVELLSADRQVVGSLN